MERFVKGDVVVMPFPFSDLSANKRRPALVVANGDLILCLITSKSKKEAIELKQQDFQEGSLKITSYIMPRKIFAADIGLVLYSVGRIKKEKLTEVEDFICKTMKE